MSLDGLSGPLASGVGSWPGTTAREAIRTVRDLLVRDDGVPYLPELPLRGPGADMVGRGVALLTDLPGELTPDGWRVAPGSGREMRRARAYLAEDVEELAEAYEGYVGPLKLQIIGPWTLAAVLELPRGEKAVSDLGAVRDIVQSLRDGLTRHIAEVRRLVPGAQLWVQLDEPSLPAVLAGQVRSASKLRRLAPIDAGLVADTLRNEAESLHAQDVRVIWHCCAPQAPVEMFTRSGAEGLALDTSLVQTPQFEALGNHLDSGRTLWAGLIPTNSVATHPGQFVASFRGLMSRIGFGREVADRIVATPACGLGLSDPARAVQVQKLVLDAAAMLGEDQ